MKTVPEMLRESASTYEERNKLYGDNYKNFGEVFAPLCNGLTLTSADDHNRFGVVVQIVSKLTRYMQNFNKGGHDDSLLDISVYAAMLRELDTEARVPPTSPVKYMAKGETVERIYTEWVDGRFAPVGEADLSKIGDES